MLRARPVCVRWSFVLLVFVAASCSSKEPTLPQPAEPEPFLASTAWDPAVAQAFASLGVLPARTCLRGQPERVELDRQRLREAFQEPRPYTRPSPDAEGEEAAAAEVADSAVLGGGPAAPSPPRATVPTGGGTVPRREAARSPAPAEESEELERDAGEPDRAMLGLRSNDATTGQPAKKSKADGDEPAPPRKLTPLAAPPRLGKLLIPGEDGQLASLEPVTMRVVVRMEGPRARTVVDLVFENPRERALQGTFFYSLPAGAAPAGFGMYRGSAQLAQVQVADTRALLPPLDGAVESDALVSAAPVAGSEVAWQELQEARVVGQKRARKVYEEIVRRNIDPALLEWSGGNTFRARVFPIPAKGLKRVVIAYEETLTRQGDEIFYSHPLPESSKLGQVPFCWTIPAGVSAEARQGDEVLAAQTWPAERGSVGGRASLPCDGRAFHLVSRAPAEVSAEAISSPAAPLPGEALYVRLRPELEAIEDPRPTGRALFLLDTSMSTEGTWQGLAARMMLEVLAQDPTVSEYAVLLFDVRPRWLHGVGWRRNAPAERAETKAELDRIWVEGATALDAVLDELADAKLQPDRVFLLSDGQITWGQDRVRPLLSRELPSLDVPWLTYRFGQLPANLALFDALARRTGGRSVHVTSEEALSEMAKAHRRLPYRLDGVRLDGLEVRDLVVAGAPRWLHPGQELIVAARVAGRAGAGQAVVAVDGPRKAELRLPFAPTPGRLAARAWAELQARRLIARDDPRLDRMIVALSQAYGLANRRASLLILDTEQDWEREELKPTDLALGDLDRLERQEEDRLVAREVGLALDGVPPAGLAVIEALRRTEGSLAPGGRTVSIDLPLAGGRARAEREQEHRQRRQENPRDVLLHVDLARERAMAGDLLGAIRALSSLVELSPADSEAARLVGYACLALEQPAEAARLFERVRTNRPFEPQAFLEEALALQALGRYADAARNFEILLVREFPRHRKQARQTARWHYQRMLHALATEGVSDAALTARATAVAKEIDAEGLPLVQLTTHWNSDSVDIDLWVDEPGGTRVYYGNQKSDEGGHLHWDITDGYGPELYHRGGNLDGRFAVAAHYYGNNSARSKVPTALLLVSDRDPFGKEALHRRRFHLTMLPDDEAVVLLETIEP